MLAIEIHRYPAVAGTLDVHGKTAGSTMPPLTENDNRRSILGYKQRCMPALLHKAAPRDDKLISAGSRLSTVGPQAHIHSP
jgi:hypothetical protein